MSTMKDAMKRLEEGADPDQVYASNVHLNQSQGEMRRQIG